jgi:hypothetical protein
MRDQDAANFDEFTPETSPAGGPAGGEKMPLSRRARLIIGIGAAVLIAVLGVLIPLLLDTGKPAALTITVFSNSGSEVTLKPGVETALNEYLASGSDVPGFPLLADASGADAINVSADGGSLFTWGSPDYVKSDKGSSWDMAPGDTVYWSPYSTADALVPQCTVTVTARQGGADAAQARLIVRQTGDTAYGITLLAAE